MSLNIPTEFERAVLERVRSGRYASAEDVLRACLEALRDVEESEETLARELQAGLDELERGEGIPGDLAFAMMRRWREEEDV